MYAKYALAGALVVGLATPAFADFYIAQKPGAKNCSVVSKKPDGKDTMMIGAKTYKTEAEAKSAMTAALECNKK